MARLVCVSDSDNIELRPTPADLSSIAPMMGDLQEVELMVLPSIRYEQSRLFFITLDSLSFV